MLVIIISWIWKIIENVKKTIHVGNANFMNLQKYFENIKKTIHVGNRNSMKLQNNMECMKIYMLVMWILWICKTIWKCEENCAFW